MVALKKTGNYKPVDYAVNPDIVTYYEWVFGKETLKDGDKIKFSGIVGWFLFRRVAHNMKTGSTWIDCSSTDGGAPRSFHLEKLKQVYRPKKSRAKKVG